jgi:hypothetical protein
MKRLLKTTLLAMLATGAAGQEARGAYLLETGYSAARARKTGTENPLALVHEEEGRAPPPAVPAEPTRGTLSAVKAFAGLKKPRVLVQAQKGENRPEVLLKHVERSLARLRNPALKTGEKVRTLITTVEEYMREQAQAAAKAGELNEETKLGPRMKESEDTWTCPGADSGKSLVPAAVEALTVAGVNPALWEDVRKSAKSTIRRYMPGYSERSKTDQMYCLCETIQGDLPSLLQEFPVLARSDYTHNVKTLPALVEQYRWEINQEMQKEAEQKDALRKSEIERETLVENHRNKTAALSDALKKEAGALETLSGEEPVQDRRTVLAARAHGQDWATRTRRELETLEKQISGKDEKLAQLREARARARGEHDTRVNALRKKIKSAEATQIRLAKLESTWNDTGALSANATRAILALTITKWAERHDVNAYYLNVYDALVRVLGAPAHEKDVWF